MPGAFDTSELFAALAAGGVVLAPSASAARQLREAYDSRQRDAGLSAWEPAPVRSWRQWLDSLWSEALVAGAETRLLLNSAQEQALWVEIVTSERADTLASADALAELARDAWNLAAAYNATSRLHDFANTHDAQIFAGWANTFARLCERRGHVSRAALEAALSSHIDAGTLDFPPRLQMFGFGDLTPAQSGLLNTLRARGTLVEQRDLAVSATHSARAVIAAADEHEELRAMAHWCRTRLESEPFLHIGVVLPPDEDLAVVEAVFRDVLAPELHSVGVDTSSAPYEITAGRPLAAFPILFPPLALARWLRSPLPLGEISALLLSPYLTPLAGRSHSAQFDACTLRSTPLLRPEMDLATLLRLARDASFGEAPRAWLEPLSQFVAKSNLTTARSFADWAEFFRALARAAGWPGEAALSRHEFHATRAWDDVLDQLATLDFRGERVRLEPALAALERLAAGAVYAPPPTQAAVQILSSAEVLGLSFQALLIGRATDTNLPPPEVPNPLLGFGLQASLDMPGGSRTRATERASNRLQRLLDAAPEALVTYAVETPEGKQRLAPMIQRLEWPQKQAVDFLSGAEPLPVKEDILEDSDPLPSPPSSHVRGGARVLQRQAACGFSAFAEFRLLSRALDTGEPGFDAGESGNLIHRVLASFWEQTQSQQALARLTFDERRERLSLAVDAALESRVTPSSDWEKAYVAVQKERLVRLLEQWLGYELKRGPFEVVEAEKDQDFPIGPLDLKLRIDRMDKVEGGVFLVDYKTGYSASKSDWNEQRPDEPQLPLYALIPETGQLKGMAFAKIRAGRDMKWSGIEAAPGYLAAPGSKPGANVVDLPQQIAEWRTTLESLAQAFWDGEASVSPKSYPHTCTHCAQRLLCRLDPASLLANAESDEDGEDRSGESHDG